MSAADARDPSRDVRPDGNGGSTGLAATGAGRRARRAMLRARCALRDLKRDLRARLGAQNDWSWKRFRADVRSAGGGLLRELPRFRESVLVAGCQRSGTTALARVIAESDGLVEYRTRSDDELDAALILSGAEPHSPRGRYCFQTTYLNEGYREYVDERLDYKLVWVLRNPYSVVFSMLYNWSGFAFDELFEACGRPLLEAEVNGSPRGASRTRPSAAKRACLAYVGKQMQAVELKKMLGRDRMMVVDYDELVREKTRVLPAVYEFIRLAYEPFYAEKLHDKSVGKADLLTAADRKIIEETCAPVYADVRALASSDLERLTASGPGR